MTKLENDGNIITVYYDEQVIYSFQLKRLYEFWNDGLESEIERLNAEIFDSDPNYLFVILTTASDQSGIVAIVDITSDRIVHVHNGSFAIKAIRVEEYVLTLYGVYYWGCSYHNLVGISLFNNLIFTDDIATTELGKDFKFSVDENSFSTSDLRFSLVDCKLVISQNENETCVDVKELIKNTKGAIK